MPTKDTKVLKPRRERASRAARSASPNARRKSRAGRGRRVLVIDIGGSKVKLLASGETKPRRFVSGRGMTPQQLVDTVSKVARGWKYDVISIGYPGRVGSGGPQSEPLALERGWVGFDFRTAFGCPVRLINDAAMQALGSYDGGRMLFLGLGTGLGSTLIVDGVVIPLELGELPARRRMLMWELIGAAGLRKIGKRVWRREVRYLADRLSVAFDVDYVVLGGGNASLIKKPRPSVRLGHNQAAFRGGMRLWAGVELEGAGRDSSEQTGFGSRFVFRLGTPSRAPRD